MPIATFGDRPEGIRVEQFDIKTGEFNGEWIKGGPLQDFSSTGILDKATATVLTIMDGFIVVDKIKTNAKVVTIAEMIILLSVIERYNG